MFMFTPHRLIVTAGLALAGLGCSAQPTTNQPAAATPPPPPPPAPVATPAQPAAAAAAPRDPQAIGRPRDQGGWNGTPADLAGKPGSYIIVNGKPAPVPSVKLGDKATVAKIVNEGKNRNQVMDHLTHLTTKIGPRLTGSSNVETANKWAMEQFKSWGLHSELYEWGTIPVRFDRGPSTAKVGTMREGGEFRSTRDMEFTTSAWAAGTNGPVCGRIIKMPETEEQYQAVNGDLKGTWILMRASAPGRRGVGGSTGARQRLFVDIRKKMESGELKLEDTKPPAPEVKPEAKPEVKPEAAPQAPAPEGIAGAWEGLATGGRIPEGGAPITLDLKLDGAAVTGTMSYTNYHSAPLKDGKWDDAAKTLTFAWEGPGGTAAYTFKLDGQAAKGESKREDGSNIAINVKRPQPAANQEAPKAVAKAEPKGDPADEPSEPKGPTIEERVFMHGPAGYISASGDDRVRTGGSYRNLTMETLPRDCEIQVRSADYDYMNSRVSDGATIYAEINCSHTFSVAPGGGPIPVYNTVAEIKGTQWPDEVVIVSAHLDSWNGPGSMGTTDNGTGSSVTIEAARILAAVGAKPKRTIRFILWTGEEQGLLGSRAYVKMLKDDDKLKNISAVFVDDGGTNFEGGLQILDSQVDFLGAATAPVNGVFWSSTDKRFLDVNLRPISTRLTGRLAGGGSDHQSFVDAGVPGYFWDEVGRADYGYGWHTQHDKIDLAIPEYLMQSSTCAAVTAYNLACAPSLLPREPLPKKEEDKKETTTSAVK